MATRRSATRRTRRTKGRPRLVWTLLSTGALVIFGFAVGLLVGAVWETPDRVLGALGGEGESVHMDVLAEPTGTTEAPAGEVETPALAAAPAPAAPDAPAATPPVSAPPPAAESGPFAVQVGSFTEPVPAWKLAEQLGEKQYEVYVNEGDAAGRARWRVRVGPVPTRDEAQRLARRLKATEGLPTWILPAEDRG